jgi:transcriptional regulator GlxA family with amidase domain
MSSPVPGSIHAKRLARVRAERAHTLLRETHQPVTEIAFACGFQSLSQFNRTFRTQFGQSPTQARQRARSPAG